MVTFTGADDRRQSYSRPGRASMPTSKSYSNVSSRSNNNNNNNIPRIIDNKANEDQGIAESLRKYEVTTNNGTFSNQQAANAYQASLDRQSQMQKARKMAYGMQGTEGNMKEVSQFHTLSDSQKQFLIDSGFAKAESSGILGGTMGAELVSNQLKQDLANSTNEEEYNNALEALDRLSGSQGVTDQMFDMGLLNPDQSAVYSWDDVESDKGLYKAFNDMQSSNLTPNNYTNYMNKISAFGHQAPNRSGNGPSGGYNYGSESGYGNGSGYIAKPQINPYNPDFAQWGRSSVQGDFIRNQKANRGGIISLMR